jgi:hypothetical protein
MFVLSKSWVRTGQRSTTTIRGVILEISQKSKSNGSGDNSLAERAPAILTKAFTTFGQRQNDKLGKFFFFGGVLLPLLAVAFETSSHFCASHFFDPFPSSTHVVLFLLIPFANCLAWATQYEDFSQHYSFMALATGMAAGIGIMYSLMFLPILGLSLVFAIAGGFGLLGLAPLLSLPCTFRSERRVCNLALAKGNYTNPHQLNHIGHLIILVMIVAIELPSTMTRINLNLADDPKTAATGLKWLRKYGSQEVMLRACYERSGRATDILGSLYEAARPLNINHARNIFYRATGKPFNSVPLPDSARATIRKAGLVKDSTGVNAAVEDEFDLDLDVAGEVISGLSRGLSVSDSSITGKLDPDALVGVLNWTTTLKNSSKYDREARAKIILPGGSVVRRATLKIGGKQYEAKILVRKTARTRYVKSAFKSATRRDPLLVSTCGPDELLVQCFPIKPSDTAQISLEIVCPMTLDEKNNALLGLPTIAEKNFLQDSLTNISITSKRPALIAKTTNPNTTNPNPAATKLPLKFVDVVTTDELNKLNTVIHAERDQQNLTAFCHDTISQPPSLVVRKIRHQYQTAPQNLYVIVDASAVMQPYIDQIVEGLKSIPADTSVQLTIVGDATQIICKLPTKASDQEFQMTLQSLKKFEFVAGQDDSNALLSTVKSASANPPSAVLWIHAAQPVHDARKEELQKLLKAADHRVVLNNFTVCAGPQEMLEGLSTGPTLNMVARYGPIASDLRNFFKSWQNENPITPEYSRTPDGETITAGSLTDAGLAQLSAYQELLTELQQNKQTETAQTLAEDYHLVSPVSSAIVTDVPGFDESTVATAVSPEADTWLLFIIAGALIAFGISENKRRPRVSAV